MYLNTLNSRADDPMRGKVVMQAVREVPSWCYAELCGDVSPSGILPGYLQRENACGKNVEPEEEPACASIARGISPMDELLPSSSLSGRPARGTGTADHGRGSPSGLSSLALTAQELAKKQPSGNLSELPDAGNFTQLARLKAQQKEKKKKKNKKKKKGSGRTRPLPPLLCLQAREALKEFGSEQGVRSAGVSWPPRRAGFLGLYSGERELRSNWQIREGASLC